MKTETPFTADTLARRWGCSGETVRAMIRNGQLPAFRVGKSYRIAAKTVEKHECATIDLDASKDAGSSSGTKMTGAGDVIALRLTRARRQRKKHAN
ncbi:excisionase family DNA-binding protein [Pseudophaeobacter sp. TrK17]